MALFHEFSASDVHPTVAPVLDEIEANYARLDLMFEELHASEGRLKSSRHEPLAGPQAARELATMYALHALELCRGVGALLDESNYVAAFPAARTLWEVWMAACYALEEFTRLVPEKGAPQEFDAIGRRLMVGRSKGPEGARYVPPGRMLGAAKRFASRGATTRQERRRLEDEFQRVYDSLSDGAHPTRLGVLPYGKLRPDGRGFHWSCRPLPGSASINWLVTAVRMPLSHLPRVLRELVEAADQA